jgi:hypothetical protein
MIWTREQAKALTDRVLSFGKAEQMLVSLNGGERANLRFARNTATTSGASSGYSLAITTSFGKKSGTVTTAEFDDASLQRAVRNAEEIARLSPDNPEAMPVLGPQTYLPVTAYFADAASATPEWRASSVATAIDLSKTKDVVSAGFVETRVDSSGRELEGVVWVRSVDRGRLQPDRANARWIRIRVGLEVLQRIAPARSAEARRSRDREGGALEKPFRDRAWQIHRGPRTRRAR